MGYLDFERLEAIDARGFRETTPYPWANPHGLLRESAFDALTETLPDVKSFRRSFGRERKFGQQSHDRYTLDYSPDLELAKPWREFIAELQSPRYMSKIEELAGRRRLELRLHWHYTPQSCSVSPHCDSKVKLGSHVFYLNREDQWDPSWGGGTLVLGSEREFDRRSAPDFDDFEYSTTAEHIGNRSLLFIRGEQSWHGVEEIACPEGAFRKVFIVAIYKVSRLEALRRAIRR
jgi:hypothetical protein